MAILSILLLIMLHGSEAAFLGPNRCIPLPYVGSFPSVGRFDATGDNIGSDNSSSDSHPVLNGNEKSLVELLLPSKNCKVDQMSGTDLGTFIPPATLQSSFSQYRI